MTTEALSTDADLVRDAARTALGRLAGFGRVMEVWASDTGFDRTLWQAVLEAGWLALDWTRPDEAMSQLHVLLDEMGRVGVATPFLQTTLAQLALDRVAGAAAVVTRLRAGAIGAVPRRPDGRPAAAIDGDAISVTGAMAEWAHLADVLVLPARAPGGLRLLALAGAAVAAGIRSARALDNERVGRVDFEGRLRAGDILLDEAIQPGTWADFLDLAALLRSAEMVGGARRMLELTASYVRERVQFGRPLGSLQAVQQACADMKILLDGADLAVAEAISFAAAGRPFTRQARVATYFCGEACTQIAVMGAHLHGGIGFTTEYPMHVFFRRAKAQQLRNGPVLDQLERAGDVLLAEPNVARRLGSEPLA